MNESPGARARVALTGLTVAEHFRDAEGQDVLLFVDNIFRFTQVMLLSKFLSMLCLFWQKTIIVFPSFWWESLEHVSLALRK